MALSVDPQTFVITVPKADTTLIQASPTEIRELNLNTFRLALKAWEAEGINEGITFLKTHTHNTEVLLGGITYARVIEILAPYTITFEDGQYAVNLVGANSNVGDRINVNQVSVRSQNSAGLISNAAIEFSSFGGAITIDVDNISGKAKNGTTFPAGTPQQPVTNITDLKIISAFRGITTINVIGNLTLGLGDDFNRFDFHGESPNKTFITIGAAANILNCTFKNSLITGTLDGGCRVENCHINDLNYIDGAIEDSQLNVGTVIISGDKAGFINCWSGVAEGAVDQTPVIDYNGSGTQLVIRNYNGGIKLINHSGTDTTSIDMASGQIIIDSTITAGIITLRGIAKLTDNSTGTAIINSADLLVPSRVTNLQYLVETLRTNHIGTGKIYYWSPVTGNDTYEGTSPELPKQSFSAVMGLVKDYNHDVIIALQENPSGSTIVTEPMVINKNWVSVRGPGVDFILRPTSTSNGALLDCTGMSGVSVSGMTIDGSSVVGDGMRLDSHESAFHDLIIKNITGHGIVSQDCHTTYLERIWITNVTLDGINIDDCQGLRASYVNIRGCVNGFYSSTSSGVLGNGGKSELRDVTVLQATTGFNIADAFTQHTQIFASCVIGSDVTTRVIDNGTDTFIEVATTVWNELEKQEALAYSKKASDNAEQANLKL